MIENMDSMGIAALPEEELIIDIVIDEGEESPALTAEDLFAEEEDSGPEFDDNLVDFVDAAELEMLAADLLSDIEGDKSARKEWEETYRKGLKLLGLKYEERSEPWEGACGVVHPMITEAVIRFQSESIMETFPSGGPVKAKILGEPTPEKEKHAKRVTEDLNYQLTERMVEFRPEHERMLFALPFVGSAFKKVYYDPSLGRQTSVFVPAEDVLIPYGASELTTCPRVTHIMRKTKNEVRILQSAGFYIDADLGDPIRTMDEIQQAKDDETGFDATYDDRFVIYEIHVDLNLPGYEEEDDVAIPHIVTIEKGTGTVLAIRRNYEDGDVLKRKRDHFVQYTFIPGMGAYGLGYVHLLSGHATAVTSVTRQLVDAGTLVNLPGGLKTRGLRIKGDDTPISPGEWRDVDVGSGTLRDNIMPLPYKEPSQVLMALRGTLVDEAMRFAATADLKVSDMSANAPVGSTLAIIERMLKVMTAVQARLHYSFAQELKIIKRLVRDTAPKNYDYDVEGGRAIKQSDYDSVDVVPVSDPNAATMSQRVIQYQAALQLASQMPQVFDLKVLARQMIDVLGIKNAEKVVPMAEDMKPRDPVSENMSLLKNEPVKAFIYQDHDAHIAVHKSSMDDPAIKAMIGQNPQAPAILAAAMAHINEHLAFKYRKDIEDQLGVPLPPPDQQLPEDLEVELSRLMAIGAKQLVDVNTANAQQEQNQQASQDPVLQLQQQELKVKQAEVVRKTQKDMMDSAVKKAELQLKAMEQLHGAKMEAYSAQLQSIQPAQPAQQPPQGQ
jgi:hypothetical protein